MHDGMAMAGCSPRHHLRGLSTSTGLGYEETGLRKPVESRSRQSCPWINASSHVTSASTGEKRKKWREAPASGLREAPADGSPCVWTEVTHGSKMQFSATCAVAPFSLLAWGSPSGGKAEGRGGTWRKQAPLARSVGRATLMPEYPKRSPRPPATSTNADCVAS